MFNVAAVSVSPALLGLNETSVFATVFVVALVGGVLYKFVRRGMGG